MITKERIQLAADFRAAISEMGGGSEIGRYLV